MASKSVAVIGAGVVGLTTALELSERGWTVTILEAVAPVAGASSSANGALTPHSDHSAPDLVIELAQESVARYPSYLDYLRDLSGLPVDHDPTGVLEVLVGAEELDEGRGLFESMKEKDWNVDWLNRDDVFQLEPHVTPAAAGGILYKDESAIDIDQLGSALIQAATTSGVALKFPTAVSSVSGTTSGSVELASADGTSTFDAAVVCTGTAMCSVSDLPTIALTRVRGELIEAWAPPGTIGRCIYRGDAFVTPRRDGRLMLGASYDVHELGMDENRGTISLGTALQTLKASCETVPKFRHAELRRVWKCWRAVTSDELPVIGPYGNPNIILALGFGGLGFTLAARTSQLIADAVDGDLSDERLGTLDPMRDGLERLP